MWYAYVNPWADTVVDNTDCCADKIAWFAFWFISSNCVPCISYLHHKRLLSIIPVLKYRLDITIGATWVCIII